MKNLELIKKLLEYPMDYDVDFEREYEYSDEGDKEEFEITKHEWCGSIKVTQKSIRY